MIFGKYVFHCQFESQAILPLYKGSLFRGVFGQALRKVVCVLKTRECEFCILKDRCLYSRVFETPLAMKVPENVHISAPPHPFVIEPPLIGETHYKKGSFFDFSFLLFGTVNNDFPYFVYAFDMMGKDGIGKRVNGKRGEFVLTKISTNNKIIYSYDDQILTLPDTVELVYPENITTPDKDYFRLTLTLETPLRLKFENRLTADLPFPILVRAMLRRVSGLLSCYGDKAPSCDYKDLLKNAEEVRIVQNHLMWFDWKRYSVRQKKEMFMGGMIGTVTYEGKLGPFLDLTEFCSHVHIGKQTAFGLGKFRYESEV